MQDLYRQEIFKGIPANADDIAPTASIVPMRNDADTEHIFEEALGEALRLMQSDTFTRFIQIDKHREIWGNYLKARAQERMLRTADHDPSNLLLSGVSDSMV